MSRQQVRQRETETEMGPQSCSGIDRRDESRTVRSCRTSAPRRFTETQRPWRTALAALDSRDCQTVAIRHARAVRQKTLLPERRERRSFCFSESSPVLSLIVLGKESQFGGSGFEKGITKTVGRVCATEGECIRSGADRLQSGTPSHSPSSKSPLSSLVHTHTHSASHLFCDSLHSIHSVAHRNPRVERRNIRLANSCCPVHLRTQCSHRSV